MLLRRAVVCVLSLVATDAVSGCTVLLDEPHEQCTTHEECQALDPGFVCASDGVCVSVASDTRFAETGAGMDCRSDAECASTAGQSLCRSGVCLPLNEAQQGCVSLGWGTTAPSDGAPVLVLGMLVPASEIRRNRPSPRVTAAVGLAILELNRAREGFAIEGMPAFVGVACDESRPESLDYMLDALGVRVIFGPSDPARLGAALAQVGGRALLSPPFGDPPEPEPSEADEAGYLLSCRPNRSSVRAYLLPAVVEAQSQVAARTEAQVGSIVAGLAVSGDSATQSFASGIDDGALAAAGVRRLPYIGEPGGRGLVNALAVTDPPVNLVVAASAEDTWESNIAAVDSASYARQGAYPYYLLAEKRFAVLQAALRDQLTADGFSRQYLRILGLDYAISDQSKQLRLDFESAFSAQAQSAAEPGLEYVYDCTYTAAYALIAGAVRLQRPASELVPEAILLGLRALQGGGASRAIGSFDISEVVSSLELSRGADGTLDLVGASGALDHVLSDDAKSAARARRIVSPAAPGGELYCIDGERQTFCETGIVFSVDGGAPSRPASERCTCLRAAP